MSQAAVVVGGTRRVGRWVSEALLVAGYRVHAMYGQDESAAQEFADEMGAAGYEIGVHKTDAANESQLGEVIRRIAEQESGLSTLVCSWGPSVFGKLSETSGTELEQLFRGNVLSVHHAVRAALPYLKEAGRLSGEADKTGQADQPVAPTMADEAEQRLSGGRIISFITAASETGRAFRDIAAYGAAKAMLYSYSRSLARELAPSGVTVNCISLGVANLTPEGVPPVGAGAIPTGRHLTQEDVAAAIWYLTSPPASQITGSVLNISGGFGL